MSGKKTRENIRRGKLVCPQCGTEYDRTGDIPGKCTKCGMASIYFKEKREDVSVSAHTRSWKKTLVLVVAIVLVFGSGATVGTLFRNFSNSFSTGTDISKKEETETVKKIETETEADTPEET